MRCAQYGITREQAQAFLASSRTTATRSIARRTRRAARARTSSTSIGPLVGRSPLEQLRVHAQRAVDRGRRVVTDDAQALLSNLRKVAPYLPAVAKWAATEGMSMLPAVTGQLQANIQRWITPTPEQQAEIARAAAGAVEGARRTVQLRRSKKPLQPVAAGVPVSG